MFETNGMFVVDGVDGSRYCIDNHLSGIDMLMSFMKVVVYSEVTHVGGSRLAKSRGMKEVQLLRTCMRLLPQFAKLNSSRYYFHPALKFFFEEYRNHRISRLTPMSQVVDVNDGMTLADLFDDFLAVMRVKSRETGLKKMISNWEGKYAKGLKRIVELIDRVFESRSRITVIRLDLEYIKTLFSAEEAQRAMSDFHVEHFNDVQSFDENGTFEEVKEFKGMVSFEDVLADRRRFFANMKGKPSLFRHLLAAVWQMECSPLAGYHIHLALIFKGSEVRKHEWLAQQIGEYWVNNITNGRGRFHNVNREFDPKSPHYGIGIIEHYDLKKRANLIRSLSYFVKKSQKAAVLPFKGCNLFGAYMVSRQPPTDRGRPRSDREAPVLSHHTNSEKFRTSEMCSSLV